MLTTPCPDPAALEQFLQGGLDADLAEVARDHVRHCPACQAALDERTDRAGLRDWRLTVDLRQPDGPALERALRALADTPLPAAALPPLPPAEALGPYRVLGELGRGGMGVVYRAHDPALDRPVAVKVLRPDLASDDAARARFVREAQATARLRHDHVVRVYAVADPPGGQPYLVMECLEGPTLAGLLRQERRLDPRRAAAVAAEAADGLAAAHAAGLVHRDVKPANVMFDGGRAKVMDFGLARLTASPSGLTEEGTLAGTPAYMSPEQARGDERLDGRADVYGLGATLYEMLTGELPFRGAPHMVLRQVLEEEPRPVRALNDAVPRDLETLCHKALAKEPHRRYASVSDLAADLRRFLNGEPVKARPVGRLGRGWRWCRRNPWIAGLSAALLAVVAAGFAGVLVQWRRAEREHQLAEARFRDAMEAVNHFHTLVSETRLLHEPGMQPLRKQLLQTARDFYARFARERQGDPAVQAELGRALFRLGSITGEVESPDAALPYFEQALAIQGPRAQENPDDATAQAELAHTLNNIANAYTETWRFDEAIETRFRSLALSQRLAERRPQDPAGHLGLFRTWHNLGLICQGLDFAAPAEEAYRKSLAAARRLSDDHPGEPVYRIKQLATYLVLAQLYREEGRLAEAVKVLDEAAPLTRDPPATVEARLLVAMHAAEVAVLQALAAQAEPPDEAARRLSAAEVRLREAVGRMHAIADANPAIGELRVTLAIYLTWGGQVQTALGRPREAEALLREALALTEKLARDYPQGVTFLYAALPARIRLAELWGDDGRLDAAVESCGRAEKVVLRGDASGARHAYFGPLLRPLAVQRAVVLCELRRFDEALADWDRVLADDAGGYRVRLPALTKRFDGERLLADGTGRYRHLWGAAKALTEARRAGADPAPRLRPLAAQAAAEADAYQKAELLNGGLCYWFALIDAAAARVAAEDDRATPDERRRRAEQWAGRAVRLLQRARRAGYFRPAGRVEQLRQEQAFAALRDRADFRELLAALGSKGE